MELRCLSDCGRALLTAAVVLLLWDTLVASTLTSIRIAARATDVKPISQSLDMQCPPCEKLHCRPRNAKRLRCAGGITRGVCNCCPVCAKLEGERCGGQHHYRGKCGRGLKCEPSVSYKHKFLEVMTPEKKKYWIPEGRCVKVLPHEQMDQAVLPYCKPKCTADFCTKNPRSVCSAVDNAERPRGCHGECQHTSCRACRFVEEEVACGKCAQDDYDCIKGFGRCMKDAVCTRKKHPCRPKFVESGLKFQCVVPGCLT